MLKQLALALAVAISISAFSAQALEVRPSAAVFPAAHKASTMQVRNTADKPKSYEVSVFQLSLVDGKQVRTKSTDIRFAPSIMTIPAGAIQTVRYVRTGPAVADETAYRILVKEIPDEIAPTQSGVIYAVNADLSWIWRSDSAKPNLSFAWKGSDLEVRNSGTATAQLASLTVGTTIKDGLVGYVLPGQTLLLKVKGPVSSKVKVMVNGKFVDLDVK